MIGKVRGSARDANDGGEEVRESSDGGGGFWGRTADEDFPTAEVVGSSQDTTFITHSTDSGDFLTGISRRYGVSFHVAILCAPSTGILLLNYRPRKFCPIPSIRQHSLTPPQSTPIPTLTSPHLTSPHPTPSPLQTPHSSTNPHLRHDPHNNALQHAKQQMSIQILILKKIQDTFFDLPRRCRVVGACR